MSECGSCSMCCKVMTIPELNKRDGQWCQHARPGKGGCSIYSQRPSRCREYLCGWRQGIWPPGEEPADMRPDRCHVVFSAASTDDAGNPEVLCAFVDPAYPDAWQAPKMKQFIGQLANAGIKVVVSLDDSTRKRLFEKMANGIVGHRWIEMTPPDENGIQWHQP